MRGPWLILAAASWLAAQSIPRPEHPQPQFQREHWLNLNGSWEFEFDDANAGLKENWAGGGKKFSRKIIVPFCFESPASGVGDPSFHPWIWYRRSFTVPEAWRGKRVWLRFQAVDYRAWVWVNGQYVGFHEGGSTPFGFDITERLKPGANAVTVRVEDPPTDRSIPRGKQYWEEKSRGIFYTRTSGIWQTVWLEAVNETHLEKVRITPDNDGTVRFEAFVANPQAGCELHAIIRHQGKTVATAMAVADSSPVTVLGGVADPRLWSPASPNLYDVSFELRRTGAVLDRVSSYFGFRSVGVENGRFVLNGRPVYLKFLLDQGYWPQSNLTPPSDEAIQYDIRMAKEMGFNGVRKHQKVEDARFLYWADRMGLLVSGEMPNAYVYHAAYVDRFTREWIEALERDYNHPSIVIWAPINESWGVPNLREPRQQEHLKALYALTKSLDPTRLVIDNEGWQHTDRTDLFAVHDYARNGQLLYERWNRDFSRPGALLPPNSPGYLIPGYSYNGAPLYLSEFGGIAYIPPGHQVPKDAWGYAGIEKTAESALARLRSLYEAIAKLPFVGICYTQITDVEQEVNGLLTYDRRPKFDLKAIRELNELLR
ncbi:MAG: glycoside hydrolase family 2 TIM barrel-domain containing protein [Bryobacterales bacterium]|nr:glycoside hydrolase family 2 TIM barrel-domain containing protein [Bryobacterales bacterium]